MGSDPRQSVSLLPYESPEKSFARTCKTLTNMMPSLYMTVELDSILYRIVSIEPFGMTYMRLKVIGMNGVQIALDLPRTYPLKTVMEVQVGR